MPFPIRREVLIGAALVALVFCGAPRASLAQTVRPGDDANALAGAVLRYARFVAARPLDAGESRTLQAEILEDLRQHPGPAAIADRRVAAFLHTTDSLTGPALEAARTSAWNVFAARARLERTPLDPLTAAVLAANPIVASDSATGIAVSRHALEGYAASVALTSRLAGRPQLRERDVGRLIANITSAFPSYPPEAQRELAEGAERWVALDDRIRATSAAPLEALRLRLASGATSPADVARLSQILENSVVHETYNEMLSETQAAFAQAMQTFGGAR